MKVRYYGILSNAIKKEKITQVRILFNVSIEKPDTINHNSNSWFEILINITGCDFSLCPVCKQGHFHTFVPANVNDYCNSPPGIYNADMKRVT